MASDRSEALSCARNVPHTRQPMQSKCENKRISFLNFWAKVQASHQPQNHLKQVKRSMKYRFLGIVERAEGLYLCGVK